MTLVMQKKRKKNYKKEKILEYKKRMLLWDKPLEFVNNMYGSHPGQNTDKDYFKSIYGKSE